MIPRRKWLGWLAGLVLLAGGLIVAGIWVQDHLQLRERRQMLSGLGLVCKLYARDHGGARPADLRVLFPTYVNSPAYLDYATNAVEYFPDATDQPNPVTILMREKQPDFRGRRWVCRVDCSVQLESTRLVPP